MQVVIQDGHILATYADDQVVNLNSFQPPAERELVFVPDGLQFSVGDPDPRDTFTLTQARDSKIREIGISFELNIRVPLPVEVTVLTDKGTETRWIDFSVTAADVQTMALGLTLLALNHEQYDPESEEYMSSLMVVDAWGKQYEVSHTEYKTLCHTIGRYFQTLIQRRWELCSEIRLASTPQEVWNIHWNQQS